MTTLLTVLVSTLNLAATPSIAIAQEVPDPERGVPIRIVGGRASVGISYDHAGDSLIVREADGTTRESHPRYATGDAPLFEVAPNRPVTVLVENANTLLYSYEVDVESAGRKSVRVCGDVGRQFAARAFSAGLLALEGIEIDDRPGSEGVLAGARLSEFFGSPRSVRGETRLTRTTLQRLLERVRPAIRQYLRFADSLDVLASTLGDSLLTVARLAEYQPIEPLVDRLQSHFGFRDATRLPEAFSSRLERLRPSIESLSGAVDDIEAGRYDGGDDVHAREALALMLQLQNSTSVLDETTVLRQLRVLEEVRALSRQTFHLSPSSDYRRVRIRVRPSDRFNDAEPRLESLPRLRTGELQFFTESVVGLVCQFSAGFITTDHPPDYRSVEGLLDDGRRHDARNTIALMFHVAHSSFRPLGALVGIGVGEEGRPDLYAGGSLRFFDPLLINLGAVWQSHRVLGEGTEPGDPTPEDFDERDLDRRYVADFFVGVSVGFVP